jgi:hypothetical protein
LVDCDGFQEDDSCSSLPCGVGLYISFGKFFGLITYFDKKETKVFSIWRHIYRFHISKLLNIDPKSMENLIALGTIFEKLFLRKMNQLYIHLRKLEIFPLDIAFGWISSFFIGQLEIDQCFWLIDRIMGFDTLHILPILALGVFKYYEKMLLRMTDRLNVTDPVGRMGQLNLVGLIDNYYFG